MTDVREDLKVGDDEQVQIGRFGGEPEDNVECRDYAWVIPMLQKSIEAERERCAKICESSAERYESLAVAARESRGPMSNSEANEYLWAAECARQQAKMIRGKQ